MESDGKRSEHQSSDGKHNIDLSNLKQTNQLDVAVLTVVLRRLCRILLSCTSAESETSKIELKAAVQKCYLHGYSMSTAAAAKASYGIFLQKTTLDRTAMKCNLDTEQNQCTQRVMFKLESIQFGEQVMSSLPERHESQFVGQFMGKVSELFSDRMQQLSQCLSDLWKDVKNWMSEKLMCYGENSLHGFAQKLRRWLHIETPLHDLFKAFKDVERLLSICCLEEGSSDDCGNSLPIGDLLRELSILRNYENLIDDHGVPECPGSSQTLHTSPRSECEQKTSSFDFGPRSASNANNIDSSSADEFEKTEDCNITAAHSRSKVDRLCTLSTTAAATPPSQVIQTTSITKAQVDKTSKRKSQHELHWKQFVCFSEHGRHCIKHFKYFDVVRQWSSKLNYRGQLNPLTDIVINIWKEHFYEKQVTECRLLVKHQRALQATLLDGLMPVLRMDFAFDKYKEDAIICRLFEKYQRTLQATVIAHTKAIQLSKVLPIHEMIGYINKNDSCHPVVNTLISCARLENGLFARCLEVEQSNSYQVQDAGKDNFVGFGGKAALLKWSNYLQQPRRSCKNVRAQNIICNGFQHLQSMNTSIHFSVLLTQGLEDYQILSVDEKYLKDKFILPFDDFRQGSDRKKGSIPSGNLKFGEKKCHNFPSAEGSRGSYKPRGLQDNRGIDKTEQETSQSMQKSHVETIEGERQISLSIDEFQVITDKQCLQRSTDQSRTQTEKLTDECYVVNGLPHDNVDEQPITAVSEMESHDTSKRTHQNSDTGGKVDELDDSLTDIVSFLYNELKDATQGFDSRPVQEGGCKIGTGSFADVYLAQLRDGDGVMQQVAIKKLKEPQSGRKSQLRLVKQQFPAELRAMERYRHPNIVHLIGHCSEPEPCLVYEYLPGGNLGQRVAKDNSFVWSSRVKDLCDVSIALNHLHTTYNPGLVHRDVKSANILLTADFEGKLADFGLAMLTEGENPLASFCVEIAAGTKAYMPPEAFKGKVSPRVDIFSFGVVMYEVLTGLPAYSTSRKEDLATSMRELERKKSNLLNMADCRAKWPTDVASDLFQLAKHCTDFDSYKRPPMAEILRRLETLQKDHDVSDI